MVHVQRHYLFDAALQLEADAGVAIRSAGHCGASAGIRTAV